MGKRIEAGQRYWWVNWLFPVAGLVSLVWFLVRVIPKPTRAAYPCQRVAGGLAGGFLVWIAGMVASVFAFRRGKQLFLHSRLGKAVLCLVIAAVAGIIAFERIPEKLIWAGPPAAANKPLGVARGVMPGRVVWVRDPNVTTWMFPGAEAYGGYPGTWDGETDMETYGYADEHTDQSVVDQMVSDAIRGVAGESSDAAAWDAILRYTNVERGKGDVGYQAGEKIVIKINLTTAARSGATVESNGEQTMWRGWINTSPQMILSVLRQLVNVVGVAQSDITVGDTSADFPNHYYNFLNGEFPNVNYLTSGWLSLPGRLVVQSSKGHGADEQPIYWSTPDSAGKLQDYLPLSYAQAEYLINMPVLKGHYNGVTISAKNHFGSFIRLPNPAYGAATGGGGNYYNLHWGMPGESPGFSAGMNKYRTVVDIMGHPHLGGKTVLYLVDAIYCGYKFEGRPYRWKNVPGFSNEWPSSILASQDPVAVDSVGYDFLLTEWPAIVDSSHLEGGAEDYLHEMALANDPCSGVVYDPDGTGQLSASLGVHEHWNNATDKQYTRNLDTGTGIELYVPASQTDPLGNGDMGLVVTKVTVKADKKRRYGKDTITIAGELTTVLDDDMSEALYMAESIDVVMQNADATEDDGRILDDVILVPSDYMKNDMFSYNKRRSTENTTLTSLKLDFRKGKFLLAAKKVDLSGLK